MANVSDAKPGGRLNVKMSSYQYEIHMFSLMFNMGIRIPWKNGLYIETGPRSSAAMVWIL